jgi:membrane protein insertase Oxa1/YidC/SpoIIIJ
VSVPGALALYYAVSNIVAVGQQAYLLRQDEEELEELAESPSPEKKPKTSSAKSKKPKKTSSTSTKNQTVTRIVANDGRRRNT